MKLLQVYQYNNNNIDDYNDGGGDNDDDDNNNNNNAMHIGKAFHINYSRYFTAIILNKYYR